MAHTKGPWWRDDDGFIASGSGDTYKTIADLDCSDIDIDEREANKSLVCAAPGMLDALYKAHDELNRIADNQAGMTDEQLTDICLVDLNIFTVIRSAIVKAEGK